MRPLLELLKPYRKQFVLGPFFKFLEAVFELLLPLIMARLIYTGKEIGLGWPFWRYAVLIFVLTLLGVLFSFLCQYMASVASQGYGTRLREALQSKVHRLSVETLEAEGAEHLLNCLNTDINKLQQVIAFTIRLLVRAPFICIGAVALSFTVDAKLALILLAVVPLFGVIISLLSAKSSRLYKPVLEGMERIIRLLSDSFTGMRVIRSFRGIKRESEFFAKTNHKQFLNSLRSDGVSYSVQVWIVLLLYGAELLLLHFGGYQITRGGLLKTELIALISYINQILVALLVVANLAVLFPQGLAAARRLARLLALEELPTSDKEADAAAERLASWTNRGGSLSCSELVYTYPGSNVPALEDLNFSLKKGETLGVIGGTGSGKTTLLHVLMGFYLPTSGEVRLELPDAGARLTAENQYYWHGLFGYASQKNALFGTSLRENLTGGAEEKEASVPLALETAQADGFIDWPEQAGMPVRTGGTNFSGGQRQRLCIARALLQDAPVLVLDNATSALDFRTAARLRQALARNYPDLTLILSSQRIETVRHADRILVLDNGKSLGLGTHEELLESCPAYREIYDLQMGGGEAYAAD